MEYSVGSLADLITGKNTPNKPKVIRKEIVKPEPKDVVQKIKKSKKLSVQNISEDSNEEIIKKKKKSVKEKVIQERETDDAEITQIKKKNKKRKLDTNKINESTETPSDSSKKRKLSREENQTEEESIDSVSDCPKKQKLSKNDKNAAKRVLHKERELQKENPEDVVRTIFVGNVPLGDNLVSTKKKLKKHFRKYGIINSMRFRGIPPADPKTSKKIAAIKSEFNPNRKTVFCYIKFVKEEDALKAQVEDGTIFDDHHLRVHLLNSNEKPDESKAIFVGNLNFDAEEDDLWKLFEPCGDISNVRIVRDSRTGMGKGFAYVNFKSADSVQLAMEMENLKLKNRELRISLCNLNLAKKNKKKNKPKKVTKPGKPKNNFKKGKPTYDNKGDNQQKLENKQYQGKKFTDNNKKKKVNKGILEKKRLVKKIAPKPK